MAGLKQPWMARFCGFREGPPRSRAGRANTDLDDHKVVAMDEFLITRVTKDVLDIG